MIRLSEADAAFSPPCILNRKSLFSPECGSRVTTRLSGFRERFPAEIPAIALRAYDSVKRRTMPLRMTWERDSTILPA